MEISEIIISLLTTGYYDGDITEHLNEINNRLRHLSFEVVQWCDKRTNILKNTSNVFLISSFSEQDNDEIKRVIEAIVHKNNIESYIIEPLVYKGWIEKAEDDYVLSKRCLVQFDRLILNLKGRYNRCSICSLLVDSSDTHEYCKNLLQKNMKELKQE